MADEIAALRQQLETERRLREEERRLREQELEEERLLREIAERKLRPNSLLGLLDGCHGLSTAIRVETNTTLTTQGETADPVNRVYPQQIKHWHDFPDLQERIWNVINTDATFASQPLFASSHQLEYVHGTIQSINSEIALRHFERDTVENFVQSILSTINQNKSLRRSLDLDGKVVFESHANIGDTSWTTSLGDKMQKLDLYEGLRRSGTSKKGEQMEKGPPANHSKGRPRNRRADEFCVHITADERRRPIYAVEFKAPHKLTLSELIAGLHEMDINRDVIDKDGDSFEHYSTRLVAAIITQLFSYMVHSGVKLGYICTGEAYVFLRITNEPSVVQYFLSVPNTDADEQDEYRLHRTAVAQVLAFTLNALAEDPPSQGWLDAADKLPTWKVEYLDILQDIPPSIRKEPPSSEYKPSSWKPIDRSPYKLRSRCQPSPATPQPISEDDSGDDGVSPSPSPTCDASRGTRGHRNRSSGGKQPHGRGSQKLPGSSDSRTRGVSRQYCTMKCINGLANGGPLDQRCPNVKNHGFKGHLLNVKEFTRQLREQLFVDRQTGFEQLHIRGRTGFLLKASLLSYGYTVVIKATTEDKAPRLKREFDIYNRLRPLQGHHIPVCIGDFRSRIPYYYHGKVLSHMLILSWSGTRVQNEFPMRKKDELISALQSHGVVHRDTALRNVLWNHELNKAIMIDFEDVSLTPKRQPLRQTPANIQRDHPCEIPKSACLLASANVGIQGA